MRLLGIDFGEKYIGLALTDPLKITARPFKTIPNNKETFETLNKICEEETVQKIILGLPKSMDGTIQKQGKKTLEFKKELESELGLPIELEDERLSTKIATDLLKDQKKKVRESRAEINKLAAQVILESYLNKNIR